MKVKVGKDRLRSENDALVLFDGWLYSVRRMGETRTMSSEGAETGHAKDSPPAIRPKVSNGVIEVTAHRDDQLASW